VSTTRDPDRLVLFTDAVVAIAVTLLILPLVEVVTEVAKAQIAVNGEAVGATYPFAVITENWSAIFSFLLSFVVIARFWLVHHGVFEHVKAYNTTLIRLNMLWLLCIVVLPFPSEILGQFRDNVFMGSFYSGLLVVLALTQTGLSLLVRGHKELEVDDNPITDREIVGSISFAACAVVAFLLSLVPGVRLYGLLALIPGGTIAKLVSRQRESRTPSAV
jgi:uncharacterized membrane protein